MAGSSTSFHYCFAKNNSVSASYAQDTGLFFGVRSTLFFHLLIISGWARHRAHQAWKGVSDKKFSASALARVRRVRVNKGTNLVGLVDVQECADQVMDDAVQSRAQPSAGHHRGPYLLGLEVERSARPCRQTHRSGRGIGGGGRERRSSTTLGSSHIADDI